MYNDESADKLPPEIKHSLSEYKATLAMLDDRARYLREAVNIYLSDRQVPNSMIEHYYAGAGLHRITIRLHVPTFYLLIVNDSCHSPNEQIARNNIGGRTADELIQHFLMLEKEVSRFLASQTWTAITNTCLKQKQGRNNGSAVNPFAGDEARPPISVFMEYYHSPQLRTSRGMVHVPHDSDYYQIVGIDWNKLNYERLCTIPKLDISPKVMSKDWYSRAFVTSCLHSTPINNLLSAAVRLMWNNHPKRL